MITKVFVDGQEGTTGLKIFEYLSQRRDIEVLRIEGRLIEIPVNYYRRRAGESKHSTSRWHSAKTGLRMIRVILQKRLNLH